MRRKTTIALVATALWSTVAPHAASAQYCYGTPGVARCAGVGLGLQSPRWYFSDNYPYWIYYYPSRPYPALWKGGGGGVLCFVRGGGWGCGVGRGARRLAV